MDSTRRQFVAATLTAMPALSYAGAVQRDQKSDAATGDPIWAQIQEDLKRIDEEVRTRKPTAQTVRAFESALRFHAAHAASKGRDQQVGQLIKRRMREKGRGAFLADALDLHRQHERHGRARVDAFSRQLPARPEPTVEELGAAADSLVRGNYVSTLRASASAARSLAESLPVEPLAGARVVALRGSMQDYCSDARAVNAGMAALKDLICLLAVFDPPMFAAECGALQFEVWLMESMIWIFCTVI